MPYQGWGIGGYKRPGGGDFIVNIDKGLRDGYKWLVKSVITNYLELGTRVAEDMVREAAEEEERRKEVEITKKNESQSM